MDVSAAQIRPRLFGTNGVRGIFGKELTPELVIDLSYSLATYFGKGRIVVGYDGRKSSPVISRLVRSAFNSAGLDVADAGLVPTPCLQFAAKRLGYAGGIMVTASHNPPEYNGIKPIAHDGVEIPREDELVVEDIFYSKRFARIDGNGSQFAEDTAIPSYIDAAISLVDAEKIRSRKLTVVMDAGNGAQAVLAPLLAGRLGCKVIVINGQVDGDFPARGSEPTLDNLYALSAAVREAGADFGVAYDGDGDRSIFCDEKGEIYWGDKTGTLLVDHLLKTMDSSGGSSSGGTVKEVVCPINTSMMLSIVAERAGAKLVYTKVGSVEVSREMVRRGSKIGLEENGGFMYGRLNEVRDGAMTTALVLDMLASTASGQKLSDLFSSLPKTFQYKAKFKCPTREVANTVVSRCMEHGSPKRVETMDGAKIWLDSETWVMVRPSGTEPLVRMYAESTERQLLDSKVQEYQRLIQETISG